MHLYIHYYTLPEEPLEWPSISCVLWYIRLCYVMLYNAIVQCIA